MSKSRIARQCICCSGGELSRSPAVLMPFVAHRVFGYEPVEITPEWGLRDVRTGTAYTMCQSVQCSACGALFLDMRFDDDEMVALYANYRDEAYTRLRLRYEPGYHAVVETYNQRAEYIGQVEAFLKPRLPAKPAILDWGGDTGINTPLLNDAGCVHIYDVSGKPALRPAVAVDLDTVRQTRYDLITCIQVLEHVSFPADLIAGIVEHMRPDTLLYLEVPYEELMRSEPESTEVYRRKRHWHEHINFFSQESMRSMVTRAGLEILELRPVEIALGAKRACTLSVLCKLPADCLAA